MLQARVCFHPYRCPVRQSLHLQRPRQPSRTLRAWRWAIGALFVGLTFYALLPATRWDWLWERGRVARDPLQQQALQDAALKSYFGKNELSPLDRQRFESKELRPASERR